MVGTGTGIKVGGVKIDTVGKLVVVLRDEVDESVSVVSVAESESVDLVRVLLSVSLVGDSVVDSVSEYDVVVWSSVWVYVYFEVVDTFPSVDVDEVVKSWSPEPPPPPLPISSPLPPHV